MTLKQWSNERWECPKCGYHVDPRESHGDDDCIEVLTDQVSFYKKVCNTLRSEKQALERRLG